MLQTNRVVNNSKRSQTLEMVLASVINQHPLWVAPTVFFFFSQNLDVDQLGHV
jgi:hypothetical protein